MNNTRNQHPFSHITRHLIQDNDSPIIFDLEALAQEKQVVLDELPYSIRVLVENLVRNAHTLSQPHEDVALCLNWKPQGDRQEIFFYPARVLMQDFTGVPCLVDLAAMRSAMQRLNGDVSKINPLVPCDLVVDHSVQIDAFGSPEALRINLQKEFERNHERYAFLKWGQKNLANFRVVPPGMGIVHQVNLEYLAKVVWSQQSQDTVMAYPDTLVGTDSHTTMINALGVLGWGVGGIEAEAVMLGEPMSLLIPDVVGVRLRGRLPDEATATDLVLTITQRLRQLGVVGKFVEYFGEGLKTLTLPDRATIANMAPEYGATVGFFPVDEETLRYLRLTGRPNELVDLVKAYTQQQKLFYDPTQEPLYTTVVEIDLNSIRPCVAGPRRPQDRIPLTDVKTAFQSSLPKKRDEGGFGLDAESLTTKISLSDGSVLTHGSVVLAAITSCTNTSNPSVLLAAGWIAKEAVRRGLTVPKYVKTSFAPGSRVVEEYLKKADLLSALEQLGFAVAAYGCTTCIGNSGPLPDEVAQAIQKHHLVAAAVLSGNRNFEGRVHPLVRANFLASPPLVVAYALAGRIDIDFQSEPLGMDRNGRDVMLKDLWPDRKIIQDMIDQCVTPDLFHEKYKHVFEGPEPWQAIAAPEQAVFSFDPNSTYIQEPPFFEGFQKQPPPVQPIIGARILALLGDSITTDHISPAGPIPMDSPAGCYLMERGVPPEQFNSYGSRRGNHHVMMRGTFANIRLRNRLVPEKEGGWTRLFPDGTIMTIFDAAMRYKEVGVPLIVVAGKEYGTGSSRDWAAKGTALLGVRAVLAESFERIHRSNLIGMGVLPLQFKEGESATSWNLKGDEILSLPDLSESLSPRQNLSVIVERSNGQQERFETICRLDTPVEVAYFRHGGILPKVLRRLLTMT